MADQRRVIQHAQEDMAAIGTGAAGRYSPPETIAVDNRGWWDKAKDWFIDKFAPEIGEMLMHKAAQGAAELSQALNSQSNAYVPYGVGQAPLEIEGPATSYQDLLREASQRATPVQQQELER